MECYLNYSKVKGGLSVVNTCESKYRNTIVCIDAYHDKVMKGRLYNPYLEDTVGFYGVMSFLYSMEEMLEQMNYPRAYEIKRSFEKNKTYECLVGSPGLNIKGEMGTFEIKILFRQNASWQGIVTWKEQEKEESFRSVLELLLLIDSALQINV